MLLRPSTGNSPGSSNLGIGRELANGRGNKFAKGPIPNEDPAIVAMRAAGLQISGKELKPKEDIIETEEKPSDVAKRTFQEHGLDFEYVASEIHKVMNESEPQVRLKALETVTRILLKSEDQDEEMKRLLEKANTPSVVINISSPYSPEARNQLDILIPSI